MNPEDNQICEFFQDGNCKYGDKCNKLHPQKPVVQVCDHPLCTCKYGEKCIKPQPKPEPQKQVQAVVASKPATRAVAQSQVAQQRNRDILNALGFT